MPLRFLIAARITRSLLVASILVAPSASATMLNSPSQTAINGAISCELIDYGRDYTNGAYTNGPFFGGASIVLAVASYTGNTSTDARLLQQIRFSIVGGNEICANGGFPAQHELHVTGMFAIAKQTPRIWSQLTAAEKTRIDLIMKASLISCAFTTSNYNPYLTSGPQRTLDGDTNVGRDWNPNYREGMHGSTLVAMVYFGGPVATQAILDGYNHAQFVAELYTNGLSNAWQTFNWKVLYPNSLAPTGTTIENSVRYYKYYNSMISDHVGIYNSLVNDTYGKNVNSGLNNGLGVNGGWGRIVSGANTLPNPGAVGMLKEFDSGDGSGSRSALNYVYSGFRSHQNTQLVLIIGGYWQKGSASANNAAGRLRIGNTDLWYKLEKGYYSYANGSPQGAHGMDYAASQGFSYIRSLWEDVLSPYHLLPLDSDGDGTDDATENRLGLNPASGASLFALTRQGNTLRWPSQSGLNFVIQRSSGDAAMSWQTIATIPGTATTATASRTPRRNWAWPWTATSSP